MVNALPEHNAQLVCLDSDWNQIATHSADNLTTNITPKHLAYVIYTSGSTGKPKGVQIPHRAVVNFLSSMRQTPGLTAEDILLSVATLSFDIAALEIYLPLIVGAQVVLVSREVATDGYLLLKQLNYSSATVMQATPATWRLLLAAGWCEQGRLKILCGGEALDRSLAHQLLERGREVWNLYGPTETTIWSAVHQVDDVVCIGRPIANTQFYILDSQQQLLPVGVPGELYIGGAGLARGYLNQPELTQQKFIPNPFEKSQAQRLYKTGDLVRYLSDGSIEFLGRIDNQVKIRGFRMELGEIEAVLTQHPAVQASVVTVREHEAGCQQLVAYVETRNSVSVQDLRQVLANKLPNYMMPAAIVMLEKLPLTPNGKVDRRALPALNPTRTDVESTFVTPRHPVEEVVAGIWAEVLGIQQVGMDDNFFELGGHSLLATQVISRPHCFQLAFTPDVTSKLGTLAREYNTSESVVLLACWQTLIWRLTGQPDIIIGMAAERREFEELYELMGLVATWLPIKSHLTPDLLFPEVIELTKQAIDAASQWQDYFVPEPVENHTHLAFPIGFEFEQLPEKIFAAGVSFSVDKQYSCIEPFKVKLTCTWCNSDLTAEFYYDVNYFSANPIQRLANQFQSLLVNVTENPLTSISQLEILPHSERQQILYDFNQTQATYSQDKCIHELFAEQAEKTPNNIAVVFEEQQLTYAELNCKANQLAHYLQQQGVKPEVVVGLYLERSLEMMIGLLGILKAGGAYLPLEPNLPQESLTFRLQDAQVSLVISDSSLINNLGQRQVICLDTWDTIAQYSDANPTTEVTTENLVYVLFTSGSTGKPKGVAIEHRQLLNYLNGILNKLNLPTNASFATVSSIAADLGNTAIFPALCTGGCLHLISRDRATNAEALAEYCDRHQGFELSQQSLMRLAVFQLEDELYEFVWSRHFIIADGWSIPLVLNEVVQIYEALCQSKDISLPPSIPFANYIGWLEKQDISQAEIFWKQLLNGVKKPTSLTNLYVDNLSNQE